MGLVHIFIIHHGKALFVTKNHYAGNGTFSNLFSVNSLTFIVLKKFV